MFGLAQDQHAWVARRQTPHPGHTYGAPLEFDPQRVASVPRTFIDCNRPATKGAAATVDVAVRLLSKP